MVVKDSWQYDYELGRQTKAKELTLHGKDDVAEKLRVVQQSGLFSKDLKVLSDISLWDFLDHLAKSSYIHPVVKMRSEWLQGRAIYSSGGERGVDCYLYLLRFLRNKP